MSSQSGNESGSLEADRKLIQGLLKIHQSEGGSGVYISNGFLNLVEENKDLIAILNDEERSFLNESVAEYDKSLESQYAANQENVDALRRVEKYAKGLAEQKTELERAQKLEVQLRAEAEHFNLKLEAVNKGLLEDLEATEQYKLTSDRQHYQFKSAQANAYPAWAFMFLLLASTALLSWADKNVEAFGTILSMAVGTMLGAIATSYTSLFANNVKEEKPDKSAIKNSNDEKDEQDDVK